MAHANQERWASMVDAKLRSQLVTRDNLIFNSRYEGDPTSGKVKIPVRDTEVAVKAYDKTNGIDPEAGTTTYLDLDIDHDEAVNELIDGYDADSVPDDIVADRLDSAAYSLALSIDKKSIAALEGASGATISATKTAATEFIAGHPNWCHRVMEWQVGVHLQDLAGSAKYIGASAVQGRKVYGLLVSKPQTLYIKRTEV